MLHTQSVIIQEEACIITLHTFIFMFQTWNGNEFGRTYNGVSREVHIAVGCLLIAIGTAGILGNGVVLFVFTR